MPYALFGLITMLLWIFCIVDAITRDDAYIQYVREQEPAARFAYELQTGAFVEQTGFWAKGRFGVSPDGLVGNDGLIEIKTMCSSATLFRAAVDGDVSDYLDQIVGELWLLGRQWCDLCLWAPDLGDEGALIVRRIERDETEILALDADLTAFAEIVDSLERKLRRAMGI